MTDAIQTGSILIENDASMPKSLRLEASPIRVAGDPSAISI